MLPDTLPPAPMVTQSDLSRSVNVLRRSVMRQSNRPAPPPRRIDADNDDDDDESRRLLDNGEDEVEVVSDDEEDEVEYVITSSLSVGSVASGWQTVFLAVVVVGIFLLVGTLFFGLVEDWTVLDALYFSTSTITTCGLGDLVPKHTVSKIFMIFYVVAAMLLIGSALGLLAQAALQRHERVRELALSQQYHNPATGGDAGDATTAQRQECWPSRCWTWWGGVNPLVQRSVVAMAVLALVLLSAAVYFTTAEGWTVLDAVYYAVIVSSTVGLGDVVSDSTGGKIFSVFLMLLGSATVATSLTSVADVFVQRTQRQLAEKILLARVAPESLSAMDLNNSGGVSQQEFLEFMLVHMGLVSPLDIAAINQRFHELDRDHSGVLDLNDLKS